VAGVLATEQVAQEIHHQSVRLKAATAEMVMLQRQITVLAVAAAHQPLALMELLQLLETAVRAPRRQFQAAALLMQAAVAAELT
jgi:hypothetical protein